MTSAPHAAVEHCRAVPHDQALRDHRRRQAEERLAAGPDHADADLVFADELGRFLNPSNVTWAFRVLVADARLPYLTPHGLRHTFATIGLDDGLDVLYLSEALGHASPLITQSVYQHTRKDRHAAAVERIAGTIFG